MNETASYHVVLFAETKVTTKIQNIMLIKTDNTTTTNFLLKIEKRWTAISAGIVMSLILIVLFKVIREIQSIILLENR